MKTVKLILFFLFVVPSIAFSKEYVVISNHTMDNLSQTQIKTIFLKKISILDKVEVIPIGLDARSPLREKFEKQVLNMSFQRLKAYWTKQHYLGRRPPLSMKSQESVKAFVKKVNGAIGYIEKKNIDKDVKVLYQWED